MWIGIGIGIGRTRYGTGGTPTQLLLDEYSGAAAAYSLRQLKSGVTNAIEVRIDTTGQPTYDIGFVNGELDTATLEGYCTGGLDAYVTTWYDQSGNGNDAEQTTAANQPQIVSSGSVITDNGKPAVYFNGSTGKMELSSLFTSQPFTVIGVNNLLAASGILADSINGFFGHRQTNNDIILRTNVSLAYGTYPTSQNLFIGLVNSTSSQIYMNGVLGITGDAGNTYSNWIYLGWAGAYSTYPSGYMSEIIAYNSDQSSNRTGIESNINAQYQIYWDGSQTSLLDTYSGSAAAYSLRALSSSYTGALIEVRRASDNATTDIYAKYDGTLNVDALESFCSGTNGFVTTWYDQSGNGNDATQSTAASQPQIVSSGSVILENAEPALDFDGSNDNFLLSETFNSSFSAFAIATNDVIDRCDILRGGSSTAFLAGSADPTGVYRFRTVSNNINYANQDLNQHLHTWINDTSTSYAAIDGNAFTSTSDTAINQTSIYIGGSTAVSAYLWKGTIQEIILYPSDQSSNRSGIETNINDFYSIY